MTVKISRVRHVLITSIIFVLIIIVMGFLWDKQVKDLEKDAGDEVHRVEALVDIKPGTEITSDMMEQVKVRNAVDGVKDYAYREYAEDYTSEDANGEPAMQNDDKWVVGKVTTEHIYKGEWINTKRLKLAKLLSLNY